MDNLIKHIILILLAISTLTACAGIPITSIWKLRNLNPLDTDPAEISIAVVTHQGVQLQDGSTSLSLGFSSEVTEHNFTDEYVASIRRNADPAEVQADVNEDEAVTVFFLNPKAAEAMRTSQNRIRAIRDQQIEGSGSLSVSVHSGCSIGPKPDQLTADIYVKFNSRDGYILLNQNLDLFAMAARADQPGLWVECDQEAH
ncbi:MAG: hypothetical protein AAF431_11185 [Pseudomonadota bacterium]